MQIFYNAFMFLFTGCDVFKACVIFGFCVAVVFLTFKLFRFGGDKL